MNIFDPVKFSIEENTFLKEALGQPVIVALRTKPADVNVKAVKPLLDRVQELVDLEKHAGAVWCGVDAIKKAIDTYLAEADKWSLDQRRGRPRFPSMHSYDSRGNPHRGAPGADSDQVKTYFGDDGQRHTFAIELIPTNVVDWKPEWTEADRPKGGLRVDKEVNRIECTICGYTESYNPESRGSYNAARGRISKHLRNAKDEVEAHRELHTNEFGG